MRRTPGLRTIAELSPSSHRRLSMYALAAGASGVGCLALAATASAEVVYTPANQIIFRNESYVLDLTNTGSTDFVIRGRSASSTSGHFASLYITGTAGNTIEGNIDGPHFNAADLQQGARIPGALFSKTKATLGFHCSGFLSCTHTSVDRGYWFNVTGRYVALKFTIQGQAHYGWARFSVRFSYPRFTAVLTGYAYETDSNVPIFAGGAGTGQSSTEPRISKTRPLPSLGLLAIGSTGLSIWKRDESA